MRRTTIEIDEELLRRAKAALGLRTTKDTVEEALRRAAADVEQERAQRADAQRGLLRRLSELVDPDVLGSEDAWR